jgi:hypothetical protein
VVGKSHHTSGRRCTMPSAARNREHEYSSKSCRHCPSRPKQRTAIPEGGKEPRVTASSRMQIRFRGFRTLQKLVVPVQKTQPREQKILRAEVRRETWRGGRDRFKIQDLLVDERCMQAIPDFLHSTDVGRRVIPEVTADEEIQCEGSEWELREREEREEERRLEAEGLGVRGGEHF